MSNVIPIRPEDRGEVRQGWCGACGQELVWPKGSQPYHPFNVQDPCPPTARYIAGTRYFMNRPPEEFFRDGDGPPPDFVPMAIPDE